MRFFKGVILFSILLSIDFFSKIYVLANIPLMGFISTYPYEGIGVLKNFLGGIDFSINYVQNTGAAWGVLAQFSTGLFYLRIGLSICLLYMIYKTTNKYPLILILSGAVGNILDYMVHGYVIDMFYFRFWGHSFAIFNIADSLICIGIFLYMVTPWRNPIGLIKISSDDESTSN